MYLWKIFQEHLDGYDEISFLDVFSASVTRPKVFQNSVQKYFQSLLVIYFQTKKKAQRYVSKPTNSVWKKQLSLVEAKPELNLQ